ncbi:MAG TPA: hypothetical protein VEL03_14960 [Streptosporangiaceae bacterium]|nr:hypothetical protein [Streptosporangiaceae bacterium]
MDPVIARKVNRTANPYASVIFLAAEADAAYAAAGLPRGPMGYFAGRAAPMGPVPAEVVIATFYNFQPDLVRSCIPAAWSYADPVTILAHRLPAVDAALRRILGDAAVSGPEVAEAAALARIAAEACQPEGRALFAGHASLPWPVEPHLALWHALTLLREHRGDGHLMALQAAGYSGCEALVMHAAIGEVSASLVATRAWSPQQWQEAVDSLRGRGLLDADGAATEAGRAHREAVEHQTDLLSIAPLEALGEMGALRLRESIRPMSIAIAADIYRP